MKKLALTLSLAAVLTVGSTQALADGVIISDFNTPTTTTQCKDGKGVIISDSNGGTDKKDGKGVIISDATGSTSCQGQQSWVDYLLGLFGVIISD